VKRHALLLIPALLFWSPPVSAADESVADSARPFGLQFDFDAAPNLSSQSSYKTGGYAVSLGFGVRFSHAYLVAIQVYTGFQPIAPDNGRPVSGILSVGGAALDLSYVLPAGSSIRPYGACGFGLYTYLGPQSGFRGYNGNGPHLEVGGQWDLSRYFSLRAGLRYTRIYFFNPVTNGSSSENFENFTEHLLSAAIRFSFYPSVLP